VNIDQIKEWFAHGDLARLGAEAHQAKQARFGDRVFWIRNVHVNYTNVCGGGCVVCHFSRPPGDPEGYVLDIDTILERVGQAVAGGAVEVHMVGGINHDLKFAYYLDIVCRLRRAFPKLFIKAFTAPEIDWMAEAGDVSVAQVLGQLIEAGLNSMPGGGAEIFSERVRRELFPKKIPAERWLEIHRTAHQLGSRTNATMLFGHIETLEERMDHLQRIKDLQGETNGFSAFVPLPVVGFGPITGVDGLDAIKTLALSRLVLDNVEHVKVFWPIWGLKLAQLALNYGADDVDGTVGEYKIVDRAGISIEQIQSMIRQAGFTPVERGGDYS